MDETVKIEKLVHGGQGLATLGDGRKAFVWGVLPGEMVKIRLIKKRKDYVEAIAEEVIVKSPERIEPLEQNYLSTSPWQIMTFAAENAYKKDILLETFAREGLHLPGFGLVASGKAGPVRFSESEFISEGPMENPPGVFHYRNKMEYSFWGDESGLHLALHVRGSRGKQIVNGSMLALSAVDKGARAVLAELQKHSGIRAGDLKAVIVRASQSGQAVASLFTKRENFPKMSFPANVQGMRVYYSNPKSPASVQTKLLYELGDATLSDTLLNKKFYYDVDSFFQVNLPIFEQALTKIKNYVGKSPVVDMYGGVGSIGLSVSDSPVIVEVDPSSVAMARRNAGNTDAKVVEASTEKVLEYIVADKTLIVDPPRAGLHKDVISRINTTQPALVIYLSCNPSTQARDLAFLKENYEIEFFEGYNFFPRTPHIESLAILRRRR